MMFAFAGFEAAAVPGGEIRDPQRDLPFALLVGLAVITALYVTIQHVCSTALPDLAHAERPVAQAAAALLGPVGATIVSAGALAVLLGTMLTQLLGTSRLLHAMGESGELPPILSRVDPRFRVPLVAIGVTAAAALGATLGSTFLQAVTITVVTRVVTWGLLCAALPVLRRRPDVAAASFVLPFGDVVAAVACLATVSLLLAATRWELALAAGLGAVGFVLRAVARAMRSTAR
jgi:amino acid transporter